MTPRLALLLLLSAAAHAQPDVRLMVPLDSVRVGEAFTVGLAVRHAPGTQVLFPRLDSAAAFGDAVVTELRRRPPSLSGEERLDVAELSASVFALDSARIGPVPVRLVSGADTTEVLSDAVLVRVASALPPDSEGPDPNAPLWDFPRSWERWLPWGLAAVLLAALGWLAWRWRRRHLARTRRPLPPHAELEQVLDALAARPLPADPRQTYSTLTDAVRRYLARTLDFSTAELTTAELIERLAERPDHVPDDAREALSEALRRADLVKFAHHRPAPPDYAHVLERTRFAAAGIERAVRATAEETQNAA